MPKILAFSGSARNQSFNQQLITVTATGADASFFSPDSSLNDAKQFQAVVNSGATLHQSLIKLMG